MIVPMHKIVRYFVGLFGVLLLSAGFFIVHWTRAQVGVEEVRNASLLKEYFLPIQALAPVEEGKVTIGPNECNQITGLGTYDAGSGHFAVQSTPSAACTSAQIDQKLGYSPNLTVAGGVSARKINAGLQLDTDATVSYAFTTAQPGIYQLRLSGFDSQDAFFNLTRNQFEYLNQRNVFSSYVSQPLPGAFQGFAAGTLTELTARALIFQVALDQPTNIIGYVNLNDTRDENSNSLNVGLLDSGAHTVYLTYVNDIEIPLKTNLNKACAEATAAADCSDTALACVSGRCAYSDETLSNFNEANLNQDNTLSKQPVLTNIELLTTQRTNDVLGVRVYTNTQHLSAEDWYSQNIVTKGTPVPFEVDGYRGVLDGRVAYINAANISASGVFYTNIYVIAYNVNASPQTVNIFNQIVTNWKFNKNILEQEGAEAGERTKDRLRRDTIRLEEINVIRSALESYKARNGHYPDLQAGTFDVGHVVSTWPTWQSVFGNALGIPVPVDPLNMMATDFYPGGNPNPTVPRQYDCKDIYEGKSCQNICTRAADGSAATGCKADQQCVTGDNGNYCSVVAPGYDALTGWNQEKRALYFKDKTGGVYPEGGYNTFGPLISGADKYKDDAFVYQYSTIDQGKTYSFNYRLEYQTYCLVRFADGSCQDTSSTICSADSCYLDSEGVCIDSGNSPYYINPNDHSAGTRADFRDIYCFAGSLVNSCGNGILQADAGESCEFAKSEGVFCDERYGQQNWYNEANISNNCTTSCQLVSEASTGQLPLKYDPQRPGLSCGGYCGDQVSQFEFNEQCDQGINGGPIPLPVYGGSGGVSADSQYECTGPQSASVLDSALIDDWQMDETSGAVVSNAKNSANPGAVINGVDSDWVAGRLGGSGDHALQFDGIDTHVTTGTDASPATHPGMTWSAWVYPQAVNQPTRQHILSTDNGGFDRSIVIEQGTGNYGVFTGTGFWQPVQADLDKWQNITVTFTPDNKIYFYKNGVEYFDPNVTAAFDASASNLNFGRSDFNGGADYFHGIIDDVKIYNRGLNNTEVQQALRGSIGGCRSTGGYCGDGQVETGYGEQCDISSFIPPSPKRSVDQISNGGFEDGHQAWLPIIGAQGLDTSAETVPANPSTRAAEGQCLTVSSGNGLRCFIDFKAGQNDRSYVKNANRSYEYTPYVNGAGFGQQVSYQPGSLADGTTSVTVRVDMRSNLETNIIAKVRLYNYDFTTHTANKFAKIKTGNTTALSALTSADIDQFDYLETTLLSVDGSSPTLSPVYKSYQADVVIPQALTTTDGAVKTQFLNNATLVAIVFTSSDGLAISSTIASPQPIYLDSFSVSSSFHLLYSCQTVKGKLCQFSGGYCGDGIVQDTRGPGLNEQCDNGTLNGTSTLKDGVLCSQFCSLPFCGDGKKGYKSELGKLTVEQCDASDPDDPNNAYCNFDCSRVTTGGSCSANNQCDSGSCVKGHCAPKLGEVGCTAGDANTCPDGSVCDPQSSTCRLRTDIYLQYHLSADGAPLQAGGLHCPDLTTRQVTSAAGVSSTLIKDTCTGLEFSDSDLSKTNPIQFYQAYCGGQGFDLPTIKQLSALMSPYNYIDSKDNSTSATGASPKGNSILRLCALGGRISGKLGGDDTCFESNPKDDRYVYWSRTPYGTDKVCAKARDISCNTTPCSSEQGPCVYKEYYAADFRNGSVDIVDSGQGLNARCVNQAKCGNGVLEADEQCEFTTEGLEQVQNRSCSVNPSAQKIAPYTAGKVHCDIQTCKLRFDNCTVVADPTASFCSTDFKKTCTVANAATDCPKKSDGTNGTCVLQNSCANICAGIGETVKSYGLNLTENYPSKSPQNNNDANRRPKLNTGINDGSAAADTDKDGCADSGTYCYDTGGNAIYESFAGDTSKYSVADDLHVSNANGTVCEQIAPSPVDGSAAMSGPAAASCPYGYIVKNSLNYNTDITAAADDVYDPANALFNQPAQRTLCDCTFNPANHAIALSGGSDIAEVNAINEATVKVETAENSRLDNATAASTFFDAQCAVTKLLGGTPDAACGTSLPDIVLSNKQPAIDLQNRLNAIAETSVIDAENTATAGTGRQSYSRWQFDEGTGRISYNTGLARVGLETGTGRDATATCFGLGCTKNINWPDGKFGTIKNVGGVDHIQYAIHLDGIDDYIYTDARGLNTAAGTISLWVKPDTFEPKTCTTDTTLSCLSDGDCPGTAAEKIGSCVVHDQTLFQYYGDANNQMEISVNSSKQLTASIISGCTATISGTPSTWDAAPWHNIALTYDFGTDNYNLYFDGASIGTSSATCSALATPAGGQVFEQMTMGGKITDLGMDTHANFFRGSLDEVRVYDKAFNQTEIDALQINTVTIARSDSAIVGELLKHLQPFALGDALAKAGISLYNLFSTYPASASVDSDTQGLTENLLRWIYVKISSIIHR